MTTPNYILIEECKIIKIKEKALKGAARYEEKALESKKELVRECINKKERSWRNGHEGKRARKRKKGLEEVRKGGTQVEARQEQERMTADQTIEEELAKQRRGGKV